MSTALPETPAPTLPADTASPTFQAPPAPVPGPPPAAKAPAATTPSPEGKVEDLPDWAQKLIYNGRDEAAKTRIESREKAEQAKTELAIALAAAAGITLPGTEVDPKKLASDLTARETELRGLRTEIALRDAAATHKADLDLLMPFLKGTGALDKLDPSSKDFAATLDALVKTTVEGNRKLLAGRAPGASGVDMTGGSGGDAQITEDQLKNMTAEQIVDAQEKGLLVNLGVGPSKKS